MNWYKRYVGDYRSKTAGRTLLEHGAYNLLIDEYYAKGGPLPAPISQLCRICGAQNQRERNAVKTVADHYFPLNGDGTRHNKRCDEEIAKFDSQSQVNSAIAKMRWSKSKPMRTAQRTVDEPQNESLCLPETRYQKPEEVPKSGTLGPLGQKALDELRVKVKTADSPDIEHNREIAEQVASAKIGPEAESK